MLRARASGVVLSLGLAAVLAPWSAISPRFLAAQATTVSLGGVVVADDGGGVGGARLELRERATGVTRLVATDAAGRWRALGLAPGTWEIVVRALGYRQVTHERVRLVLGQQATLDVTLERAATELAPSVITGERSLEVQRTDVSTAVLQEEIERLPLHSRNVHNLAAVAPGIRTFGTEGGRTVPAAGAMPTTEPRFSNFYVDGIDWKGMYVGQVAAVPAAGSMVPQEAVREFRVYLLPYDVEHTRGASYVVSAVTHRGGDTMEGSTFAFFQNRALVAKGTFDAREPDYGRWQFGGNLRGPLVRGRLFYSASYEGQHTDDSFIVSPGRPPEHPDIWDRWAGQFRAPTRHHTGLLRLTAPVGAHTLDAIWATRHIRGENGFGFQLNGYYLSRDAGLLLGTRLNSLHLRDTWTRASFVNELSLHAFESRFANDLLVPGPARFYPGLQFGRANYPADIGDRRLGVIDKASFSRDGPGGRHVVKTGVELRHARSRAFRPLAREGTFTFATDTSTLPALATIGLSLSDPASDRGAESTIAGWLVGAWLQDQWQPVPTLTIGAGVRWDAEVNTLNQSLRTPWATDTTLRRAFGEDLLNTGDRANDLDNVAPRLFVSWDPTGHGRTFLRGGFGVLYDRVALYGVSNERLSVDWRTYTFPNPGTTDPAALRRRVTEGGVTCAPTSCCCRTGSRRRATCRGRWASGRSSRRRSRSTSTSCASARGAPTCPSSPTPWTRRAGGPSLRASATSPCGTTSATRAGTRCSRCSSTTAGRTA
jgi:hypothetical protein